MPTKDYSSSIERFLDEESVIIGNLEKLQFGILDVVEEKSRIKDSTESHQMTDSELINLLSTSNDKLSHMSLELVKMTGVYRNFNKRMHDIIKRKTTNREKQTSVKWPFFRNQSRKSYARSRASSTISLAQNYPERSVYYSVDSKYTSPVSDESTAKSSSTLISKKASVEFKNKTNFLWKHLEDTKKLYELIERTASEDKNSFKAALQIRDEEIKNLKLKLEDATKNHSYYENESQKISELENVISAYSRELINAQERQRIIDDNSKFAEYKYHEQHQYILHLEAQMRNVGNFENKDLEIIRYNAENEAKIYSMEKYMDELLARNNELSHQLCDIKNNNESFTENTFGNQNRSSADELVHSEITSSQEKVHENQKTSDTFKSFKKNSSKQSMYSLKNIMIAERDFENSIDLSSIIKDDKSCSNNDQNVLQNKIKTLEESLEHMEKAHCIEKTSLLKELNDFRNQTGSASRTEAEFQDLVKTIKEKNFEYENLKKERNKFLATIKNWQIKIQQLEAERNSLMRNLEESQSGSLNPDFLPPNGDVIKSLISDKENLSAKVIALDTKNEKLVSEIEYLKCAEKQQFENIQKSASITENLELKAKIEVLETEISSLIKENESIKNQLEISGSNYKKAFDERDQFLKEKTKLQQQCDAINSEIEQTAYERNNLQMQLKNRNLAFDSLAKEQESKFQHLMDDKSDLEKTLSTLQMQYDSQLRECTKKELLIKERDQGYIHLEQKMLQYEVEIDEKNHSIKSLTSKIALLNQLELTNQQLLTKEEELHLEMQSLLNEIETLRAESKTTKLQLQTSLMLKKQQQEKIKNYEQNEIMEKQKYQEALYAIEESCKTLVKDKESLNAQLQMKTLLISEKQSIISSQIKELEQKEELTDKLQILERSIKEIEKDRDAYMKEVNTVNELLRKSKAQLEEIEIQHAEELDSSDKRLEDLLQNYDALEEKSQKLERAYREAQAQIDNFKSGN